jgi:hypothetical protein
MALTSEVRTVAMLVLDRVTNAFLISIGHTIVNTVMNL